MKILVLNAGSSSQKSRLYELGTTLPDQPLAPLWQADTEWMQDKETAHLKVSNTHGAHLETQVVADSRDAMVEQELKTLWSGPTRVIERPDEIALVGHRVVHGGPHYRQSVLITQEVKDAIRSLFTFAPLHNPINLEGIEAAERILGKTPQVAVFDTAFHSQLPQETLVYPGPYEWYEEGVRRYGFHGISYQYCTARIPQVIGQDISPLRTVVCHLGNGCSLAAIQHGHSIDTTMGFTPLEGLMMGGRSGTIDPSILIYLMRERGYNADQLEKVLNKDSGLKGVSGVSSDMREVKQAAEQGNARAKLALALYTYRLRYFIGAMVASLGGLDILAFAGGVGENDVELRAGVCEGLAYLGLQLDPAKNAPSHDDREISTDASSVRALVIHTEEDWEIAKECWKINREIVAR